MFRSFIISIFGSLVVLSCFVNAFPDSRNPNSEYELINPRSPEIHNKPMIVPITTPRSVNINTPPPPPINSKNFIYNPVTKTWTEVKKNDPLPEDAIIWNQSNDKWLTMVARV